MSSVPLEEKFGHELSAATVTRPGLLYITKQKINWVESGQVRVQELLPAQRTTAATLGIALTSLIRSYPQSVWYRHIWSGYGVGLLVFNI